jgi:hypothetical protein
VEMPTFDEMVRLAKTDPETLENIRRVLIEDLIADAPESYQRRLRGLQFQIDMERRKAGNPMGACVAISKMMHDSLFKLRETMNGFTGKSEFVEPEPSYNTSAEVLSFPLLANR